MAATTEKVSVSLATDDLAWARQKAETAATSLSSVLTAALRRERQFEARGRLLEELGTADITAEELEAARAEWR
ncbi:MAG TPA: hypothetical protein VFX59_23270 [Polyangiales bacterium]|nr:hypothetical protein [Polyangiales bacterium]